MKTLGTSSRPSIFVAAILLAFVLFLNAARGEGAFKAAEKVISSLRFREADIQDVLRALAEQNDLNIAAGKDVRGTVTLELKNVTLKAALDAITAAHGYAYDVEGDIIRVMTLEAYAARKQAEAKHMEAMEKLALEGELITEVFELKYVDPRDMQKILTGRLSEKGSISVLRETARGGWLLASFTRQKDTESTEIAQTERQKGEEEERSSILVVTDLRKVMEEVRKIIQKIDVPPKRALIETRIIEVPVDDLKDKGLPGRVS